jgi:hypothetical protein
MPSGAVRSCANDPMSKSHSRCRRTVALSMRCRICSRALTRLCVGGPSLLLLTLVSAVYRALLYTSTHTRVDRTYTWLSARSLFAVFLACLLLRKCRQGIKCQAKRNANHDRFEHIFPLTRQQMVRVASSIAQRLCLNPFQKERTPNHELEKQTK